MTNEASTDRASDATTAGPEELRFTADAALIDRLGRELVGRQETALTELVKNAYDADATEVKVTFDYRSVVIDDNGTGMNRDELINGFLRLASGLKIDEPRSRNYRRQRAGRKGIGRFASRPGFASGWLRAARSFSQLSFRHRKRRVVSGAGGLPG